MPGVVVSCAIRWFALAMALCATPALAQNAPDAGQAPPKDEPPPVADKGTTSQLNCVDESNKHMGERHHLSYRIHMTNKCEQRLKCKIFAAAYSSKGVSIGRATLILAAKSKNAPAQIYDFKIKGAGGMTSSTRECKAI
jgi:hypothetical protein